MELKRHGKRQNSWITRLGRTEKSWRSNHPASMFETPPLEINFLRKASSYAQEDSFKSAFFLWPFGQFFLEKSPYISSLRFKTRIRDSWGGSSSPRILSPTRWKFTTHGMTSTYTLRQSACHTRTRRIIFSRLQGIVIYNFTAARRQAPGGVWHPSYDGIKLVCMYTFNKGRKVRNDKQLGETKRFIKSFYKGRLMDVVALDLSKKIGITDAEMNGGLGFVSLETF